jgi:hypothetical protein
MPASALKPFVADEPDVPPSTVPRTLAPEGAAAAAAAPPLADGLVGEFMPEPQPAASAARPSTIETATNR